MKKALVLHIPLHKNIFVKAGHRFVEEGAPWMKSIILRSFIMLKSV